MGALRVDVSMAYGDGIIQSSISEIYIYRMQSMNDTNDVLEYYASRVPPDDLETVEERSFTDPAISTIITTPHVKFMHKYSDGAELCLARAIIALEEAGMNV
jgi:hypothetical protein